jgi:uncharacterized protein (TIGR03067 family)
MRFAFGMAVVLAAGLALAQDKKDDKRPAKLEGTYLLTGIEMGGEKLPDEFVTKGPEGERTIKITADKLIATKKGKEDAVSYKVDATKTPAHIDVVEKKEGGKDQKMYGIYKIDGDTLTICAVESEKPEDRPKEFKTAKDSRAVLMTLKRKDK